MFGGNHEYRYAGGLGILVERRNDVEPADLRHHQVEHDQIRQLSPRCIDCLPSAVGAEHGARQPEDPDRDQLDRLWIVVDNEDLERISLRQWEQAKPDKRLVQLLP